MKEEPLKSVTWWFVQDIYRLMFRKDVGMIFFYINVAPLAESNMVVSSLEDVF